MFETQRYLVYNYLDRKAKKSGEAWTSDCFWLGKKSNCHFQMNKSDLQILGYTVYIKLQIIFSLFFHSFSMSPMSGQEPLFHTLHGGNDCSHMWTTSLVFSPAFLSQWFTGAHSLLTPFLVFWLHNYRIIASLYLTQQGVLNHWNREITDWDGMICWSQRYYRLLPPLWWENRQEGGRVSAGRSTSTLHQSTACSCVYTETSTKAPTHIWRFVAMDTRRGCPSQKIELN